MATSGPSPRTRFGAAAHVLVFVIAAIVIGLRIGSVLDYAAWKNGTDTVMGSVEDIQASRQVRVIRYTYVVGGWRYAGEITSRTGFAENTPALVTYAKSDPKVSTLQPERMDSIYRVSLVLCVLAPLPMLVMWVMEIAHSFRRRKD